MLEKKLLPVTSLKELLFGKFTAFTTGVFDGLHAGHTRYLKSAKEFADILVVGIHSDALVKKRKGDSRPHFPDLQRAEVIAHLPFVDFVLILETQEVVEHTIRNLSPSILVVSRTTGDHDNSPEKMTELFGNIMKVKILEATSEFHTSSGLNGEKG